MRVGYFLARFVWLLVAASSLAMSGCSSSPPPEKLRFYLEAVSDTWTLEGSKIWEIADLKYEEKSHPAGVLINFDLTVKAVNNFGEEVRTRDEMIRAGWRPLDEMVKADERFSRYDRDTVWSVLLSQSDKMVVGPVYKTTTAIGNIRHVAGQVLASKTNGEWQFAKLEFKGPELNPGMVQLNPKFKMIIGTKEWDAAVESAKVSQKESLDAMLDRLEWMRTSSTRRALDRVADDMSDSICHKRCDDHSTECFFACKREMERRAAAEGRN